MDKRLRPKYGVFRLDEAGFATGSKMNSTDPSNVDSPFVLMPRKDPAAFAAMIAYAGYCEPQLSVEIKDWLRKVVEADHAFGTQGTRNYRFQQQRAINDII